MKKILPLGMIIALSVHAMQKETPAEQTWKEKWQNLQLWIINPPGDSYFKLIPEPILRKQICELSLISKILVDDPQELLIHTIINSPLYCKELIEVLIAQGLNPRNCKRGDREALFVALQVKNNIALQALLHSGINVNRYLKHTKYVPPLNYAIIRKNTDAVRLLLAAGANPNLAGACGITPLHLAASQGNIELIDILIAHNADKRSRTEDDDTPYDIAREAKHNEIIIKLLKP